MMWIIGDQGHGINLDHYTGLDWKEVDDHYEVVAVRDFRHLGMVYTWDKKTKKRLPDIPFQTYRLCNCPTEKAARDTVHEIIGSECIWIAPRKEN